MDPVISSISSVNPTGSLGTTTNAQSISQSFSQAFEQARAQYSPVESSNGIQTLLNPLLGLNQRSAALAAQASPLEGATMKPSELMKVTMRSHEFLFHCELVSNVANRSSDGIQQLFRQQS